MTDANLLEKAGPSVRMPESVGGLGVEAEHEDDTVQKVIESHPAGDIAAASSSVVPETQDSGIIKFPDNGYKPVDTERGELEFQRLKQQKIRKELLDAA